MKSCAMAAREPPDRLHFCYLSGKLLGQTSLLGDIRTKGLVVLSICPRRFARRTDQLHMQRGPRPFRFQWLPSLRIPIGVGVLVQETLVARRSRHTSRATRAEDLSAGGNSPACARKRVDGQDLPESRVRTENA